MVAEHLGKPFAPRRIVFVDELPKTRSAQDPPPGDPGPRGGEDPGDLSSLENPGALDAIRDAIT